MLFLYAVYSLIIFSILILIIIPILRFNKRREKQTIRNFEDQGYRYIKPTMSDSWGSLKFQSPTRNITYEIVDHFLIGQTPSELIYYFRVTNQKGREIELKRDERMVFHHLDQFKISTTNAEKIRLLFSNLHIDTVNNLFNYITSLEMNSKEGNLVITAKKYNFRYGGGSEMMDLHDDPNAVSIDQMEKPYNHKKSLNLTIIKYLEVLIDIMNLSDFKELIELDEYKCFNCGFKLSYYGDLCTNCGVIAPKCVICFEDPEPNETVILFNCCSSYAHHEHAKIWIDENNKCPSCRSDKPHLIRIREIMSDSEVEGR